MSCFCCRMVRYHWYHSGVCVAASALQYRKAAGQRCVQSVYTGQRGSTSKLHTGTTLACAMRKALKGTDTVPGGPQILFHDVTYQTELPSCTYARHARHMCMHDPCVERLQTGDEPRELAKDVHFAIECLCQLAKTHLSCKKGVALRQRPAGLVKA